ncbi:MAG: hypothetical protein HC880_08995 [Bacteroidia bacterium]|nr:hypothetical protein [Bacteroidia bacterium]
MYEAFRGDYFFILIPTFGQTQTLDPVEQVFRRAERVTVSRYNVPDPAESSYFSVSMTFEGYNILNIQDLTQLKAQDILAVDLVYSLYPLEKKFDTLNLNRLISLHALFPTIFVKTNVTWRLVGQHFPQTRTEAQSLFHGFYIYYLPMAEIPRLNGYNTDPNPENLSLLRREDVYHMLETNYLPPDSTVYRVLRRNALNWEK